MYWLLGILLLVFLYGWFVEPSLLTIRREAVRVRGLDRPVRILFLSDFQVGLLSSRLSQLLGKLRRLRELHEREPFDLILLGGDYIDSNPRYLGQFERVLEAVAGFGLPAYAVLGNHDLHTYNYDEAAMRPLLQALKAHGVRLLRNELAVFDGRLAVAGIDELENAPEYGRHGAYVPLAEYPERVRRVGWYRGLDDERPDLPRVMLVHNPDGVWLPGRRPDLVIAGHTHGGMAFFLDWLSRPLWFLVHWFLPGGSLATRAGRLELNGRTLVIGQGLGGSAFPFRLLRPPEAVIVTLAP